MASIRQAFVAADEARAERLPSAAADWAAREQAYMACIRTRDLAADDLIRAVSALCQRHSTENYDRLIAAARSAAATDGINLFDVFRDKCVAACYEIEAGPASESATGSEYAYMQMIRWIDMFLPPTGAAHATDTEAQP